MLMKISYTPCNVRQADVHVTPLEPGTSSDTLTVRFLMGVGLDFHSWRECQGRGRMSGVGQDVRG